MIDKLLLLLLIILPLIAAVKILIIFRKFPKLTEAAALSATLLNLLLAIILFKSEIRFFAPWLGWGLDFSLRLYHFSAFIILAIAGFSFLIALYSVVFMRGKPCLNQFYVYFLLTLAFANGVVLSDNLLILLFFWEGLLLTLFGMIAIGNKNAFQVATKAFIIVGITDLCMMIGIALTGYLSGTMAISQINLPLGGLASLAFILLIIGAISKSGSMPFHSWIPDAAMDAPLPFMALIPAAFEKLLGIYFLTRICLDMFRLNVNSWLSILLMIVGAVTIILAVMMALIQKNYKRLLSYHAISQVGYMILGIGTAVPAGIVGGLFHMINNALYKSCLFLTGGAVEKQTGTTNLEELGGIGSKMPVTFICFIITALSISGVPPFNGFFSKELVYDGALQRGNIFYIIAVLGSFFTAASFLKLGHAAFLGKLQEKNNNVREVSFSMLLPMIVIALLCIVFGVFNYLPLNKLIGPILGESRLGGHNFSGFPVNMKLVVVSVVVLIAALLNHIFAVRVKGSAIKASDHIHHAPVLSAIYDRAEKRFFDPYDIGMNITRKISKVAFLCDKAIDWIYNVLIVKLTFAFTNEIKRLHNGSYSMYLVWSLLGLFLVAAFLVH
ncbi:MAG: proton-conducting transporter membrane subunit [Candidatus Omnitrophica bacterium]|nr:proton-conducting transporter membrane subunit [Candidatus Omnitrophota bacterium]MDD5352096.1 proton-conducting transporter membrane subunit [Candidatus Omnitrophota bacterium]MDD5549694.1 proton-conducting transporter membrane subunit [Candidatus Omnitrophota bacterium]